MANFLVRETLGYEEFAEALQRLWEERNGIDPSEMNFGLPPEEEDAWETWWYDDGYENQMQQRVLVMMQVNLQFIWDNLLLKANVLKINNLPEFEKKLGLAWVLHQVMDEVDLLQFIQLPCKHLQLQV